MSRLSRSVDQASALLADADLSDENVVRQLLELTYARRRMDLTDLSPAEQASLVAERSEQLQPSPEALAKRVIKASEKGRPFIAKLGIDPTGAELHIGHTVPMMMLSRFQRMGHLVVFIVGDVTAKIGDPSGRSEERPPLTDEDIAQNLATYRRQASPFFDFEKAEFRHNGDWLRLVTLPRLIEITAHVPLSMSLQREDFRNRLAAGHSLSLAELLYSVAMAIDSVEVHCDLEVGGIDQFLNMQMCRKVMEICGQEPELVVATPLLEGTDGTGAKMSKSAGNYVPLTAQPSEVFGKVMSIPDRLMEPYLKALSEWQGSELALAAKRLADGLVAPDGPETRRGRRGHGRPARGRRRHEGARGLRRPLFPAFLCRCRGPAHRYGPRSNCGRGRKEPRLRQRAIAKCAAWLSRRDFAWWSSRATVPARSRSRWGPRISASRFLRCLMGNSTA